jgi:branched-chain amino acid transport system substrate-binding protein
MGKRRVSTIVLNALLIFSICFVCFPISKALAKDQITAGFSMALTGIYSPMAVGQMGSYQLWEEVVNQQGGIYVKEYGKKLPIKLVYYDDKSQAEAAVKIYEKLITDDKVDVLLSPQSTTIHFAIAPLAEKYKVPIVGSTAASVKLREVSNRYFWFITACVPDRQMKALVDLLKSLGVKKVAVIYLQDLFPRENLQFLQPELKKAGIQTVVTKDYPPGVKDLTTLLTEVKGKNPEAVIALCYPADAFLITTQAQEVGLDPKLLFELVGPLIDVFAPKFGGASDGITAMGHWSPKGRWPGAKEFYDRYVAKFNKKPDFLDSALSYSECQIVQQAIEGVGSLDRGKLRDFIATKEFQTINGPMKFTKSENLQTPSMVLQLQKGDVEVIWPEKEATAKPLYPKPGWPKK